MLNQLVFAGRVVDKPVVEKTESGKDRAYLTLAVPRSYKNSEGVYDTDFIDFVMWGEIANRTAEFCEKGDVIGIRGRVETNVYETESGDKKKATNLVAEKVTFLSSSKNKDVEKSDEDLDM